MPRVPFSRARSGRRARDGRTTRNCRSAGWGRYDSRRRPASAHRGRRWPDCTRPRRSAEPATGRARCVCALAPARGGSNTTASKRASSPARSGRASRSRRSQVRRRPSPRACGGGERVDRGGVALDRMDRSAGGERKGKGADAGEKIGDVARVTGGGEHCLGERGVSLGARLKKNLVRQIDWHAAKGDARRPVLRDRRRRNAQRAPCQAAQDPARGRRRRAPRAGPAPAPRRRSSSRSMPVSASVDGRAPARARREQAQPSPAAAAATPTSVGCSTAHSCRSTMRWLARAWKPSSAPARVARG